MATKPRATIDDLYKVEGKAELVNREIVCMSPTGGVPGKASRFQSIYSSSCLAVLHGSSRSKWPHHARAICCMPPPQSPRWGEVKTCAHPHSISVREITAVCRARRYIPALQSALPHGAGAAERREGMGAAGIRARPLLETMLGKRVKPIRGCHSATPIAPPDTVPTGRPSWP
jgi:hypothetical protein